MTETTLTQETRRTAMAPGFAAPAAIGTRRWLRRAGLAAFGALLVAQGVFVLYLLGSYGRTTLVGQWAAWARFSYKGWVPGDTTGNSAMALHILFGVTILLTGAIQLVPVVRQRAPVVHRWSGRVYLSGCLIAAISGLLLVWGRGTVGDLTQHVAISINALLLLVCAGMAWRTARRREFGEHKVWAVRTYVTGAGVLFFRLFLGLWLLIFRAPVGFDPRTFSGPFLTTLAITAYVVGPLGVYELYRRAERSAEPTARVVGTAVMGTLSVMLLAGTVAATLILWLPRLK